MMKKVLIFSFALFSIPAFAQPVAPSEYILKVTPAEVDTIAKGLQEVPFKEAAPLINKLRQQVMEQQMPKKPVDNPKPDPDPNPEKK